MNDPDLAHRLDGFLTHYRIAAARDPRVRRLTTFLRRVAALRRTPRVAPAAPTADPARLERFLAAVAGPLAALRAQGAMINPWTAAGLRRAEVRNAAVLATFWSPQACGARGIAFLDAFCRHLADPAGVLPSGEQLRAGYHVRTEHCPVGEASERVDLTIEGRDFVLGIEVKIDAAEGPDQLARYVDALHRWGAQRRKRAAVVFLAPYRSMRSDVVHAGWRDVAAAGRVVVPRLGADATYHDHLLDGFIRHIANFGGTHGG